MDFDPNKDYYKVLGVDKNASKDDIKKAFRSLSKKWHPDICKESNAQEMFASINEAHEVLSDDTKRRQYDDFRENGGGMDDMFSHFRNMHGGFGGMGGFNPFGESEDYNSVKPKPSLSPEQGTVAKVMVETSFEESLYGVDGKKFSCEVLRECTHCHGNGGGTEWVKCPKCHGTGWLKSNRGMMMQISNCSHCHSTGWIRKGSCEHCHGTGVYPESHDFTVNVPRGAFTGSMLRLDGVGHRGLYNGPNGDLIVFVKTSPSERFAIGEDGQLYTIHRISPITAILGSDKEEVVTPWGICEVKLPAGCEDGSKLRLRGQGLPNLHNPSDIGDLYVIIEIVVDKTSDKNEIKKLEEFRKWYDGSSLSARLNAQKQNDVKYMDDVKEKFDIRK